MEAREQCFEEGEEVVSTGTLLRDRARFGLEASIGFMVVFNFGQSSFHGLGGRNQVRGLKSNER